ncbi:arylesterase [Desulfotalea psychrophila]|uniref:Related arylesterase [Precursor] n=1 Tax=Desulfotalea psychrophila (strain LSv54 / DSM 12343) TaxID=177439 RepID=Q6AS67_DESPS|nr:arylesterase [Desulfotalea psychrophila]CAG34808.1 related arylesterase [Precursor] [Desulfotalea psychrophila LSv54]
MNKIYAVLLLFALCACRGEGVVSGKNGGRILAVGDSLTAGYGLEKEDAYPALLQTKLARMGYAFEVINLGVSGEVSAQTLARASDILAYEPDIVILETGANDGLRGYAPAKIKDNISQLLQIFADNDVVVVLAGMKVRATRGQAYMQRYNRIYSQLEEDYSPVFFPFFLEGVALDWRYNQLDRLHPNQAGYQIIVDNILPFVVKGIERVEVNR